MPLIAPILDDRSFEEIFQELRNRIPVYNPAWTDFNESDPGITLLQLFAYLGEGLQFRFNQIPEATQLAFLKLLDIPLYPARPAQALVRFDSKVANGITLYAGDQVKAGKIPYTLEQDGTVWPLDCLAVARNSLLSNEELGNNSAVQNFIATLDKEVSDRVRASIDELQLAKHLAEDDHVAPYQILTLPSDGTGPALDFANTVDNCMWIAVLLKPDANIALSDIADSNKGLKRADGRNVALSLGFAPANWYPTIDQVTACQPGDNASLQWQASLTTLDSNGQPQYQALRIAADSTAGFTQTGVVRIELPTDLSSLGVPQPADALAGTGDFPPELDDDNADKVWFWIRVWRSDDSRIGSVQLVSLNTLPCVQLVSASPELLGTGNGQPGQQFQLAYTPVLLDERYPVKLQVEESGIWIDWQRVDNLDASQSEDRHFTVDAEAGIVSFASCFPQLGQRVRVTRYDWGGGDQGNLPAASINKIGDVINGPTPPAPLLRPSQVDLKCSNPLAAQGGVNNETLEAALARIPVELRRNHRAVAKDDFAELARQTPSVKLGRAECLPLFHAPSRLHKPGCVSVVIWPASENTTQGTPLPDARELSEVCHWLDRWRLVTTELYVIPPTYRRLALVLAVKVEEGYGLDAIRDWLETLLRQYLSPLPPYGPDGQGWPLGRTVRARELEGAVMQVEGVEYIEQLRMDIATSQDNGTESWHSADTLELSNWQVPTIARIIVVNHDTALPPPGQGIQPPLSKPAVPVPVIRDEC